MTRAQWGGEGGGTFLWLNYISAVVKGTVPLKPPLKGAAPLQPLLQGGQHPLKPLLFQQAMQSRLAIGGEEDCGMSTYTQWVGGGRGEERR